MTTPVNRSIIKSEREAQMAKFVNWYACVMTWGDGVVGYYRDRFIHEQGEKVKRIYFNVSSVTRASRVRLSRLLSKYSGIRVMSVLNEASASFTFFIDNAFLADGIIHDRGEWKRVKRAALSISALASDEG